MCLFIYDTRLALSLMLNRPRRLQLARGLLKFELVKCTSLTLSQQNQFSMCFYVPFYFLEIAVVI